MKIFITGSEGFIGSHLVEKLIISKERSLDIDTKFDYQIVKTLSEKLSR